MEEFRDIKGYEGRYQVSNKGRVKSKSKVRELILKNKTGDRYPAVNLYTPEGKCKTRRVHQLVAEAFLGHTPCGFKLVVDHIDGNKMNNDVSNLRLVDTAVNIHNKKDRKHKYTSIHRGVSFNERDSNWKVYLQVESKYRYIGVYETEEQAAEASVKLREYIKLGLDSETAIGMARGLFK